MFDGKKQFQPEPRESDYLQKMSSLLSKKQKEEEARMKMVVDSLKNKANKKCHFKLMRNVDQDAMLKH